tara:strand:- start:732 stop:923 length:192 start_codon:yes stop_codon:yes gene_type:complete
MNMGKGTLVQLLDIFGKPVDGYIGTVTGFNDVGRVHVYWHTDVGGLSNNAAFQWGRLKVLATV